MPGGCAAALCPDGQGQPAAGARAGDGEPEKRPCTEKYRCRLPERTGQRPLQGAEIYLLHKSFIDAGGAPQEIYKTLLEKTAGCLGNKTQKGFSAESLVKYSDKVDPESKDTVKRFLQKMIRNIESYD